MSIVTFVIVLHNRYFQSRVSVSGAGVGCSESSLSTAKMRFTFPRFTLRRPHLRDVSTGYTLRSLAPVHTHICRHKLGTVTTMNLRF